MPCIWASQHPGHTQPQARDIPRTSGPRGHSSSRPSDNLSPSAALSDSSNIWTGAPSASSFPTPCIPLADHSCPHAETPCDAKEDRAAAPEARGGIQCARSPASGGSSEAASGAGMISPRWPVKSRASSSRLATGVCSERTCAQAERAIQFQLERIPRVLHTTSS